MTSTGIYTPGSIWANAIASQQVEKAEKKTDNSSRQDAHLYVLGSKGAGKSTLLSRFLYPDKVEVAKPSQGLEYTFARKASAYDHERKDLAHIWEVAGTEAFAQQIAQGSQIFLTYRQVTTAVVLILLDLSDPGSVISNALHWLDLVKRKLASTYNMFERKKLQLPEQLRARQRARLFKEHEDKDLIDCSGVSIVLVATKWDAFRDTLEAEPQRVLARSLRWLAHSNAAHLLYLGGLQPGGAAGPEGSPWKARPQRQQQQQQQLLDNFTRLLNHLLFAGLDHKMLLKLGPQFDHLGALMVPAGADRFRDIGAPQQQLPARFGAAEVAMVHAQWAATAAQLLPPAKQRKQQVQKPQQDERYSEEDVDNARSRREAALEAYRQEVEAIRRAEAAARKAAAGGSSSTSKLTATDGLGEKQHHSVQRNLNSSTSSRNDKSTTQ